MFLEKTKKGITRETERYRKSIKERDKREKRDSAKLSMFW